MHITLLYASSEEAWAENSKQRTADVHPNNILSFQEKTKIAEQLLGNLVRAVPFTARRSRQAEDVRYQNK